MADTRQVANIFSVILDESIYATRQVLALLKYVSHHSIIGHVQSADVIVKIKEIKVGVFNQTNTEAIIKEALIKKRVKEEL